MEGVTDAPMRAVQGETGAFSFAVSEFFRVNHVVPYKSAFYRHVPELRRDGLTDSGLPVQVQLLGGNAELLAASARVAVQAGAQAIDLNFGCPARTVNKHDGGATLLKYPRRIREIVTAVRAAVPREVPVSAKLRLGWDTLDAIFENAEMAAEGGASWLTIHARTRVAGYAPPVHWSMIGRVRERLRLPVVANGDIWTLADFRRCRDETGCSHFMVGRGSLANPRLPLRIAEELDLVPRSETPEPRTPFDWTIPLRRLVTRMSEFGHDQPSRLIRRLKQWLNLASAHGDLSDFDLIKRAQSVEELFAHLKARSVHITS
jgi:tRNA-dihydrouridine synthase C